jgi:hypothetical protein
MTTEGFYVTTDVYEVAREDLEDLELSNIATCFCLFLAASKYVVS